jgi:hypothetical protein
MVTNKNKFSLMKEMDKIREPFLKKVKKCKTQKCSKQNKKRMAEQKRYLKEENKQCSKIVDDYEYYDCTVKLYEKSKYKKLFDKWVKQNVLKNWKNCKNYK